MVEEDDSEDSEPEVVDEEKDEFAIENFSLCPATITNLKAKGIKSLFQIQALTFNHIMSGKDVIGAC